MKESDGKFQAYSRICASNLRRQPVILTDKEKEKIDSEHPGSYGNAIHYGTDPNNKYWYICPRYWSLRDRVSLTQEQVDSGRYGSVIPLDAKTIPPGGNIYELNSSYYKDKDNNYINLNPGFLDENKHSEGYCIPCCFKSWDSASQQKRRKECTEEESIGDKDVKDKDVKDKDVEDKVAEFEENDDKSISIKKSQDINLSKSDEYIKGPEKFPLEKNKWGHLPLILQYFLNFDSKKCYKTKLDTNLKPFQSCLLRRGINNNKMNSFIACIADIYKDNISIQDFKNLLITIITIDIFVNSNNGNLVQLFKSDKSNINLDDIDIEKYNTSYQYKNIDVNNKKHTNYLKTIIDAYQNFISYINSDNLIDYTYLWDIICKPNDKLFPEGINMIIFEINNNDITGDVSIICPTNTYSNHFFDNKKKYSFNYKAGILL